MNIFSKIAELFTSSKKEPKCVHLEYDEVNNSPMGKRLFKFKKGGHIPVNLRRIVDRGLSIIKATRPREIPKCAQRTGEYLVRRNRRKLSYYYNAEEDLWGTSNYYGSKYDYGMYAYIIDWLDLKCFTIKEIEGIKAVSHMLKREWRDQLLLLEHTIETQHTRARARYHIRR